MAPVEQPASMDVPALSTPKAQLTAELVATAPFVPSQQQLTAQARTNLPALPQPDHPPSFYKPTPPTPSAQLARATASWSSLQQAAQEAKRVALELADQPRPTIQQQKRQNHSSQANYRKKEIVAAEAAAANQPEVADKEGEKDDAEDAVGEATPSPGPSFVPDFFLQEPWGSFVPPEHQQPQKWMYPNGGAELTVTMGSGRAAPTPTQPVNAQHAAQETSLLSSNYDYPMIPAGSMDAVHFGGPVSDQELSKVSSRIPAPPGTQRSDHHIKFQPAVLSARERSRRLAQRHAVPAQSRFFAGVRLHVGYPAPQTLTNNPLPTDLDAAAGFQFADPLPAPQKHDGSRAPPGPLLTRLHKRFLRHFVLQSRRLRRQVTPPAGLAPTEGTQDTTLDFGRAIFAAGPSGKSPQQALLARAPAATSLVQDGSTQMADSQPLSPFVDNQLSAAAPSSSMPQQESLAPATAAQYPTSSFAVMAPDGQFPGLNTEVQPGSLLHAQAFATFPQLAASPISASQQVTSDSNLDPALDMQDGSLLHAQAHAMLPDSQSGNFVPAQPSSVPQQPASTLALDPALDMQNGNQPLADAERMPPSAVPRRRAPAQTDGTPSPLTLPSPIMQHGRLFMTDAQPMPSTYPIPVQLNGASLPSSSPSVFSSHSYQQHASPALGMGPLGAHYPAHLYLQQPSPSMAFTQAVPPYFSRPYQQYGPPLMNAPQPMPQYPTGRRLNYSVKRSDGILDWGRAAAEIPATLQTAEQTAPAQVQTYPTTSPKKRKRKQSEQTFHWEW